MNKTISAFLLCLLLVALAACSAQGSGTEHADGEAEKEITEGEQEPRIISTTVAITEIMDELELDLVGVPTSYKELPPRYDGVLEVGNVKTPDLEMIRALNPTEVLSVSTLEYDLRPVFEEVGIEAKFVELDSLQEMLHSITGLGEAYEREAQAAEIVTRLEGKVADIQEQTAQNEPPTVLILLGIPGSYLVATEHSYIGDLVKLSGGINVVTGESVEYVASNTEYLQQSNPDVILRAAHGMPEEVVEMFDQEFKQNDIWKHFDAVKNGRVYDLEEELFGTTANLAAAEALDELIEMLYPSQR
ncbi:heme ABC transporter substrate-binding protein IsdE [Halalkalibacter oceani]|uniref:heme ABC transporter substrate-binding protein IsdE n=1 Tax=Halalkalibacter oceani TaxID=1653776 RepID=UPI003391A3D3